MSPQIAFLGAGNMATAMITGLIAQGFSPAQLRACDPSEDALARLEAAGLTQLSTSPEHLFADVDLAVLAVKPQVVPDALSSVGHQLSAGAALLSIAAGIPVSSLRRLVAEDVAVIRCMPNTPAMIGLGASALYAGDDVNEDHRALAEQVTNAAGTTVWVVSENLLDACPQFRKGPAYFALTRPLPRRTELGLDEKVAMSLTLQTAMGGGAGTQSDAGVAKLRENVTSPGGTTEQHYYRCSPINLKRLSRGSQTVRCSRGGTGEGVWLNECWNGNRPLSHP